MVLRKFNPVSFCTSEMILDLDPAVSVASPFCQPEMECRWPFFQAKSWLGNRVNTLNHPPAISLSIRVVVRTKTKKLLTGV